MFVNDEGRWARRVFGQARLGDERRTTRLVKLAAAMARQPRLSVDAACGGCSAEAEGAHRLVRNPNFGADAIFSAGARNTAEAAAREVGQLLAVEDTTTLGFPHSVAESLGDMGGIKGSKNRGWFVHTTLLFAADTSMLLGPITQRRWCRPVESRGQRHRRKQRPYRDKESFKWERASRDMAGRLGPETMRRVISVCDREADVFEYLAHKVEEGQRFVVRASWDRKVASEESEQQMHLWGTMEQGAVQGRTTLVLEQKGGRARRSATLSLRFREVTLTRPNARRETAKGPLSMWALLVKEEAPPAGVGGLEWMLLTSEAMEEPEQALRVLGYYQARWGIEDWHKAWKSGCAVEDRRQQEEPNLEKVVVITAFVATRMLQLRALANAGQDLPCETILEEPEWRCLWLSVEKSPLPTKQPTVEWAHQAIGKLGGWRDTKLNGKIGWQSLYRGLTKLQERTEGFKLALSLQSASGDVTK